MSHSKQLKKRLKSLESHLSQENPILLRAVTSFRKLDKISQSLGALQPNESFATKISWWPMVAILGTYSSGKSTFINHYIGKPLQLTGNQAVDDRFTVICYSTDHSDPRVLPGLALDADPRFPFYRLSQSIEGIASGEGQRIDAYLQLKTCSSDVVRGKIVIDSPGFDADAQRTSTLRITDHIIDLSDLVLVFFDARHPEAGTMRDTLEHLVAQTIQRSDSNKFLYVLNQIDTTAREDNPEDVIASWQRALAQKGLTAGRFYRIYNPDAAVPIPDDTLRERFESKRDIDLDEIHTRMRQVGVDRAYRIVGVLEQTAKRIEDQLIPKLQNLLTLWRYKVLRLDGIVASIILAAILSWTLWTGTWEDLTFRHSAWEFVLGDATWRLAVLGSIAGLAFIGHFMMRGKAASDILSRLKIESDDRLETELAEMLPHSFRKSTRYWRSIFLKDPAGWGSRSRRRLDEVIAESNTYVQRLNDQYTDPSGTGNNRP